MTTTLVTGGGGFIGGHLTDRLLQLGHTVRVLDNFSTGRRDNLRHTLAHIELIEGDLRDPDTVRRAMQGAEIVFHEGALPSVPRSVNDPRTTNAVNVEGTLNVL
ncbi:MAG TPA: NAD-dependent epimerase/dehydratase family protein, partial [Roseiflexaceae bacterium]